MSADDLDEGLDHRAGLLGVSGSTADVRLLQAAADQGDARAGLALRMFADRAASGIAAIAVSLPRVDAVVFTGGIGEHAGQVRGAIVDRLRVLGVARITTDESRNDRMLTPVGADPGRVPVLRVEAREDVVAARAALSLMT